MSNVPIELPPSLPLKVYSCRQTSQRPPSDCLLVPDLPPPPTPTVETNLPVVIHKCICSTRNPSPHYTSLSYHRLSQSFMLAFHPFLHVNSKICR